MPRLNEDNQHFDIEVGDANPVGSNQLSDSQMLDEWFKDLEEKLENNQGVWNNEAFSSLETQLPNPQTDDLTTQPTQPTDRSNETRGYGSNNEQLSTPHSEHEFNIDLRHQEVSHQNTQGVGAVSISPIRNSHVSIPNNNHERVNGSDAQPSHTSDMAFPLADSARGDFSSIRHETNAVPSHTNRNNMPYLESQATGVADSVTEFAIPSTSSAYQNPARRIPMPLTCRIARFTTHCAAIGDFWSLSNYHRRANQLESIRYDQLSRFPDVMGITNDAFDSMHHRLLDEIEQNMTNNWSTPQERHTVHSTSQMTPTQQQGLFVGNTEASNNGASHGSSAQQVPAHADAPDNSSHDNAAQPRRTVIDPRAIALMTRWYDRHREYPYPPIQTCELIAGATRLNVKQVQKWYSNKRVTERNVKGHASIVQGRRARRDLGPEAQKADEDLLKRDIAEIYNTENPSSDEDEQS